MKMERKWIFRSFFLLLSAVDGAESVGIECVVTRKEFNSIKGEFASSIKAVHVQQSDQVRQRWKGVSWKITIVSTLPWLKIHFFLSFTKLLVLDNKSWKTKFCSYCSHRAEMATSTSASTPLPFKIAPKFRATIPPTGIFLQFWTIFSLTFVKHNGIIYFSYTKKSILVFARRERERARRKTVRFENVVFACRSTKITWYLILSFGLSSWRSWLEIIWWMLCSINFGFGILVY